MDENPRAFHTYLEKGSAGLQSFIPGRIIHADSLLAKVKERRSDYMKVKDFSFDQAKMRMHYQALKNLYPYAKFPPVYFVMGRFNSGGTFQDAGLIIGVEMLSDVEVSFLIMHECIHVQQNRSKRPQTLLGKAIIEGSADFIAELLTGELGNKELYDYCQKNQESILEAFAQEMNQEDYSKWLFNVEEQGRPANMGYWVGYKICEALYSKADDKKLAINRILNNTDYQSLLEESGILRKYLVPTITGIGPFENNATNVDFELSELSIHFNHKMQGSSFRPIREAGISFPLEDIIGYDPDHKSFRLSIKLEPNKEYAFKVTGRGFKNEYGYPIEDYEIRFRTKER